jgi:hypothetical protein
MREAFAKQYGAKPVLSCTYSAKLKQQAVSEVKVWLSIGVKPRILLAAYWLQCHIHSVQHVSLDVMFWH